MARFIRITRVAAKRRTGKRSGSSGTGELAGGSTS